MLESIVPIENVITNLKSDLPIKECNYKNSFDLHDSRVKLFGLDSSCSIAIDESDDQILILSDISATQLAEFDSLYSRMISPNILVSRSEISKDFLKNKALKYFIYSSEVLPEDRYFKMLQNLNIKVIDTYNNGAIGVNITQDNELSIYSQLKDF